MIPVAVVRPIVEGWVAQHEHADQAFQVLAMASDVKADSRRRRFTESTYKGRTGADLPRGWWALAAIDEADVDEFLSAAGLPHLWYEPPLLEHHRGSAMLLACEDCSQPIRAGDYVPLDLMRPDSSASHWVWDTTKGKPAYRPRNTRVGGRRFRRVDLCSSCAAAVIASKGGRKPKRGGRPRLLTDDQLRAAHVVYERGEKTRSEIARRMHESGTNGTVDGIESALLYGWRRLGLPVRSRSETMAIVHVELGHQVGVRAAQTANKKRCTASTTSFGRQGGRPCSQWALPGTDHCWNHTTFGVVPRIERRERCVATTQRGRRCAHSPVEGGDKCSLHVPGSVAAQQLRKRIGGTSATERPENLTTYATVQPALRQYIEWARGQPRRPGRAGAPPLWPWLLEELATARGRWSATELSRYANGPADARMMKSTARDLLDALARVRPAGSSGAARRLVECCGAADRSLQPRQS